MNIALAFAEYLQSVSIGTLGQDIFIGQAPSSNKVPDAIWWLKVSGGTPTTRLATGESLKNYTIEVYRRSRDYGEVYQDMQDLEELLNCDGCTQLDGYDTIDIVATNFPIDSDLDHEDRKIGLLQATLTTYKTC